MYVFCGIIKSLWEKYKKTGHQIPDKWEMPFFPFLFILIYTQLEPCPFFVKSLKEKLYIAM